MDSKAFWQQVRDVEKELLTKNSIHGDFKGQPEKHSLYIVSKQNRQRGSEPGFVVIAGIHLSAQRIVEETHVVATEEQIKDYLAERQAEGARTKSIEDGHKAKHILYVQPQEVPLAAASNKRP